MVARIPGRALEEDGRDFPLPTSALNRRRTHRIFRVSLQTAGRLSSYETIPAVLLNAPDFQECRSRAPRVQSAYPQQTTLSANIMKNPFLGPQEGLSPLFSGEWALSAEDKGSKQPALANLSFPKRYFFSTSICFQGPVHPVCRSLGGPHLLEMCHGYRIFFLKPII